MKMLIFALQSSLILCGLTNVFAARYDNFKVYTITIKDEHDLSELKKIANDLPLLFLKDFKGPDHGKEVVIDPANQNNLESKLHLLKLNFSCIIEDLQRHIEESQTPAVFEHPQTKMNWTHYQSLAVIYNWLDELAASHPNLIEEYVIGYSYEKRPIKAIRISSRPGNYAIFIEANIHAIEWISSAAGTCFINKLVNSLDKRMKFLLQNYDWIFVPILNPDGFVYTHEVNKLWRKNRKPTGFYNASGQCNGTDLNRNFDYKWGVDGYNFNVPCDHWYGGGKSNTEPEVLALQNFFNTFKRGYIRIYLALHSYGNYVLLPYGHTKTELPPNYDQMMRIATAFADAAAVKYGTKFKCGSSGTLNYPVSGASKDWAYGVKNVPFTATLELRDKGQYGFFLPANQILEVCEEITDGIVALCEKATQEGLFNKEHQENNSNSTTSL